MTRRLIAVAVHDDVWSDGECIEAGYVTETDAGPATAEQVKASDDAGPCGFIRVGHRGDVVIPGSWDDQQPGTRTCYVEVER